MKRLLLRLRLAHARHAVDVAVHQWHQHRKLTGLNPPGGRARIAAAQATYARIAAALERLGH